MLSCVSGGGNMRHLSGVYAGLQSYGDCKAGYVILSTGRGAMGNNLPLNQTVSS